jgi:serine/threonine-protein kinase
VLCDFGISRDARYPRAGMLGVATPEYVSPEQASEMGKNHKQVDPRSDIFSLGVLLYETLTGRLPFKNIGFVCDANYTPPPPSQFCPSMPDRLEAIVMRALARNPEHRFQKAREMRQALEKVPTPPDWKAAARRTFTGVTLAACVVTGGWSISRCRGPSTPQATRTSTITPSKPPVEATETPTLTPSSTPTAPSKATSTPAPTLTPTNTYPPPTLTPTGEPEQEGN